MSFNFELGSTVVIKASGETGTVIARSEHLTSENQYLVEYKSSLGTAVQQWWGESSVNDSF